MYHTTPVADFPLAYALFHRRRLLCRIRSLQSHVLTIFLSNARVEILVEALFSSWRPSSKWHTHPLLSPTLPFTNFYRFGRSVLTFQKPSLTCCSHLFSTPHYTAESSRVHVAIVFYRQFRNIFHPHVFMLVEYVFVGETPSHLVTPILLYSQTSVWDDSNSQNDFFRKMTMLLVSLAGFKRETASAAHTMFLRHGLNNSFVLNNFDSEIVF
ncbi:hypothetical protein Tsp_13951 [Trichinella spiralis]|uniref:hypothetical protein n=1 Tax=Trichinella spiralis TaxID=6334 RepID=UPI0001EFDEBC|nr:hypothetical protein Tsp_13951 [Trichinella spiralis]